jgi:hypothetical protein
MQAFHNSPETKLLYLTRVANHAVMDEVAQGFYWQNGHGCAVGCTIHGSDHTLYEIELGVPTTLARLQDHMFESMTPEQAKLFPLAFIAAIPVGANLENILTLFASAVLTSLSQSQSPSYCRKKALNDCVLTASKLFAQSACGIDVDTELYKLTDKLRDMLYYDDMYEDDETVSALRDLLQADSHSLRFAEKLFDFIRTIAYEMGQARTDFFHAMSFKLCEILRNAPVPGKLVESIEVEVDNTSSIEVEEDEL